MEWLTAAEVVGLLVIAALLIPLVWLFARRRWLSRHTTTIDCSRRLESERSFTMGLARYHQSQLQWFRVFSLGLRPAMTLTQGEWQLVNQRQPNDVEAVALYRDHVLLELTHRLTGERVDVALAPQSAMGLASWLESAAPGLGYYTLPSAD